MRKAHNGVHGCTNFMGHVEKEGGFGLVGCFRPIQGVLKQFVLIALHGNKHVNNQNGDLEGNGITGQIHKRNLQQVENNGNAGKSCQDQGSFAAGLAFGSPQLEEGPQQNSQQIAYDAGPFHHIPRATAVDHSFRIHGKQSAGEAIGYNHAHDEQKR